MRWNDKRDLQPCCVNFQLSNTLWPVSDNNHMWSEAFCKSKIFRVRLICRIVVGIKWQDVWVVGVPTPFQNKALQCTCYLSKQRVKKKHARKNEIERYKGLFFYPDQSHFINSVDFAYLLTITLKVTNFRHNLQRILNRPEYYFTGIPAILFLKKRAVIGNI